MEISKKSRQVAATKREKVTAVLIAESFTNQQLRPLTHSVPAALLPVHNTPLIDFHLESLIRNRVNEVYVVAFKSYRRILHHLNNTRTATGKCWTESNEIKVTPIEGSDGVDTLYGALQELVAKNIVDKNFIFISIDTVCTLNNLRELYSAHLARAETVEKMVMTMIVAPTTSLLRDTMNAVCEEYDEIFEERHASAQLSHHHHHHGGNSGSGGFGSIHNHHHGHSSQGHHHRLPPATPMTSTVFPGNFSFDRRERDLLPTHPSTHHVTVAFDAKTNVVRQYKRWVAEGDDDGSAEFSPFVIGSASKHALKVRTDLELTGIFICNEAVVNLFTQFLPDFSEFVEDLLANELTGNQMCVDFASVGSCTRHISNVKSYVDLNVDATARFLHPMTRSSNFAEPNSFYSCSHRHTSSVFIHIDRDRDNSAIGVKVGPRVVVGPRCVIAPSSSVRDCVLGRAVRIGENCDIAGCVILDDVMIADGTTLRNSVIGADVRIGRGVCVAPGCILGKGVRIEHSRLLTIEQNTLIYIDESKPDAADATLVGDRGRGVRFDPTAPENAVKFGIRDAQSVLMTKDLFVSDLPPAADDEEEEEGDADADFAAFIQNRIDEALHSPSKIKHVLWEIVQTRHNYSKDNTVLLRMCTSTLLQKLAQSLASSPEKRTPKEALKSLKAILEQWLEPFYEVLMQTEEDVDALLSGLALGLDYMPGPSCDGEVVNLLHSRADHILAYFYTTDSEKIAELVTKDAILAFDDFVRELQDDDPSLREKDDERVIRGWAFFAKYVNTLRNEDDDED